MNAQVSDSVQWKTRIPPERAMIIQLHTRTSRGKNIIWVHSKCNILNCEITGYYGYPSCSSESTVSEKCDHFPRCYLLYHWNYKSGPLCQAQSSCTSFKEIEETVALESDSMNKVELSRMKEPVLKKWHWKARWQRQHF